MKTATWAYWRRILVGQPSRLRRRRLRVRRCDAEHAAAGVAAGLRHLIPVLVLYRSAARERDALAGATDLVLVRLSVQLDRIGGGNGGPRHGGQRRGDRAPHRRRPGRAVVVSPVVPGQRPHHDCRHHHHRLVHHRLRANAAAARRRHTGAAQRRSATKPRHGGWPPRRSWRRSNRACSRIFSSTR